MITQDRDSESVELDLIKQGISQYLVMGYSNSQCKRGELGENPHWVHAQKGTDDIEKYYVPLFEREFLFMVSLPTFLIIVGS
jgi:hypothetical protein